MVRWLKQFEFVGEVWARKINVVLIYSKELRAMGEYR